MQAIKVSMVTPHLMLDFRNLLGINIPHYNKNRKLDHSRESDEEIEEIIENDDYFELGLVGLENCIPQI